METKLTANGADALLDMEPFIIIQLWWNGIDEESDDYERRERSAYIQATNIPTEHSLDALRKNLEEATQVITDIQPGLSTYLCQMKFYDPGPQASYSHDGFLGAYEPDCFWEITSFELMSYEALEVQEVTDGTLF